MQSGNGIDLAAIYQLLTEVAGNVAAVAGNVAAHDRRFEQIAQVLDEHSRKIDDLAAGLREVRLTLYQYHQAVIGAGVSLTRLEKRVGRIEDHLHLDPAPD